MIDLEESKDDQTHESISNFTSEPEDISHRRSHFSISDMVSGIQLDAQPLLKGAVMEQETPAFKQPGEGDDHSD